MLQPASRCRGPLAGGEGQREARTPASERHRLEDNVVCGEENIAEALIAEAFEDFRARG